MNLAEVIKKAQELKAELRLVPNFKFSSVKVIEPYTPGGKWEVDVTYNMGHPNHFGEREDEAMGNADDVIRKYSSPELEINLASFISYASSQKVHTV